MSRFNGPGDNYDQGYAIASDPSGNIYVTGSTENYGVQNKRDIFTVKYGGPSSAGDDLQQHKLNIFPNPAGKEITISIDADCESFRITDLLGRTLVEGTINLHEMNRKKVNISALPSGIYIVNVFERSSLFSSRLIVE